MKMTVKKDVSIDPLGLSGHYVRPDNAVGLVLFAHGSGSSRLSPRNNYVADALNQAGLATLLFDLLTEEESANRDNVFDIPLLSGRLEMATDWIKRQEDLKGLPLGYFGASTGAAAALVAAANDENGLVYAVVSRGGRPDMAIPVIDKVKAPTLLIVGGNDFGVIELNEEAYAAMHCEKELQIVPGATHLFEETGTLDQVINLTANWFLSHMKIESSA